jgi:H+/gluconate symporter-like permease
MNPYITEFLGLNILAGIMGSGTAAVQTFFQFFTQSLVAKGASAAALHRIAPAAVTGMNTLPNAGGMVAQLKWMDISLAEGYWYVFVTSVLAPIIGSFCAVVVAMIMY